MRKVKIPQFPESVVPSVPRDVEQIDPLEEKGERSMPVGSVQPTQSSMILAGHPDVMYQNIFPSEMSISKVKMLH